MVTSSVLATLDALGATGSVREEMLRYDQRRFDHRPASRLPLEDEPFVETWREWHASAQHGGAYTTLAHHLPQLRFPIRAGISQTDDYRAATLQGQSPDDLTGAVGLTLERPERIELELYSSSAGRVPLIITRHRPDFVSLTQALAKRNEPATVPDGQGAAMISGYNNWYRIARLRAEWQDQPPAARTEPTWPEAFARIRSEPSLYRDRIILLSDGPYSGVPAEQLGFDEATWRQQSLAIRREHECTHYLTQRLYGSAKNHLLDELLADYAGFVAAFGHYDASWFLRCLGLAPDSAEADRSRLALYRGDPPLSEMAFAKVCHGLGHAARNVERFDRGLPSAPRECHDRTRAVVALAKHSLLELTAPDAPDRLAASVL